MQTFYVTIKLIVSTNLDKEITQMALDSDLDYQFTPPDGIEIIDTEYIQTSYDII